MLGLEICDSRLKGTLESLDKGNHKKALSDINKVLKKTPSYVTAKALKAIVLWKSGKSVEAASQIDEVVATCPTDESTVSVVLWYFRETGQTSREDSFLKTALQKCPDREDLLICLFLSQVQAGKFLAQQTTARTLSQRFSSRMYAYWVIVSTLMQADTDPVLAERMFLPLAEKMLLREASSGQMRKHTEFQLLVDLLWRVGKYQDALDLLDSKTLIDKLDAMDYSFDYSEQRLKLLSVLDRWDEAFALGKEQLAKNPDNWTLWMFLIQLALKAESDGDGRRLSALQSFMSESILEHSDARGPKLARLDLLASITMRSLSPALSKDALAYLRDYLINFSCKPICSMDIAYLLPSLLPDPAERSEFLGSLLDSLAKEEITVPPDVKQIHRHLCTYQIARANNQPVALMDLLKTYFSFCRERKTELSSPPEKLGDEQSNSSAVDLCPSDGFLLLVLSALVESRVSQDSSIFGLPLLAAYWTEYLGIAHAPNNHHFRLRLCSLFSPHCLACPDLSLCQLDRLDVKRLLLASLGHTVVHPAPMLTIWLRNAPNQSQTDSTNSIQALYQSVVAQSSTAVSEAQEGISSAYRRCVYTKVREFTQFADRLRHADAFLLARVELACTQILILPNDFDSALENVGAVMQDMELANERLEHIADCRDFTTSPTFDSPMNLSNTQADSFDHLTRWIRLRLVSTQLFRYCSEVVMSCVVMTDRHIDSGENVGVHDSPLMTRAAKAKEQLSSCLKELDRLIHLSPRPSKEKANTVESLIHGILLPSAYVFSVPLQLPAVQLTSLYVHGPFVNVLKSGTRLVSGLYQLLVEGVDSLSVQEESTAFSTLSNPFSVVSDDGMGVFMQSNWSAWPTPSSSASTNEHYLLSPGACPPSGVLLLLGVFYEIISASCLFISSLHTALRPRSHFLAHANKRQRKKGGRNLTTQATNGACGSSSTTLTEHLDSFGLHLLSVVMGMTRTVDVVVSVAESWTCWAKGYAENELFHVSSHVCSEVLTQEFIEQFPVVSPIQKASIFHEIANSYAKSFDGLVSGLRSKGTSLTRMQKDLQVFDDCVKKMSECKIGDVQS